VSAERYIVMSRPDLRTQISQADVDLAVWKVNTFGSLYKTDTKLAVVLDGLVKIVERLIGIDHTIADEFEWGPAD
jgi:hypothetical protein